MINKKKIPTIFILLVLVMLIAFFAFTNYKLFKKRSTLNSQIDNLQTEIDLVEDRNKQLKGKQENMEGDEYIESVARNQLDLRKPGEDVIVIQKKETSKEEEEKEKDNFWGKFMNIFKK